MSNTFELDLFDMRKDYSKSNFDESNLASDPFEQFGKWFNEVAKNREFEPNAMSLATSDNEGNVSQRMVLLKQINSQGFIFFTNYLSKKGVQISQNNKVSLLFFWANAMRQVRIEGVVEKISDIDSDSYFNDRPQASKASAKISKQSQELVNKEEFDRKIDLLLNSSESIERPSNWGGYIVKPVLFEFWQGGKSRSHDRIEYYKKDGLWESRRLYP